MVNYDEYIGKNIKEVRKAKNKSQQDVAKECGFANTVLSAYENGKKIPSLTTIATIARALDVSIERLYYGDDSNAFINMVPDEGRKIVNAIYYLWDLQVIDICENYNNMGLGFESGKNSLPITLLIYKYSQSIKRLINGLNEFKDQKDTYENPEAYLEMFLSSVAKEINLQIENERK